MTQENHICQGRYRRTNSEVNQSVLTISSSPIHQGARELANPRTSTIISGKVRVTWQATQATTCSKEDTADATPPVAFVQR